MSAGAYDWTPFFDAVRGQGPRETLTMALDLFEAEDAMRAERQWRFAVDLGCGEGRDLREMLRRHRCTWWKAIGIDTSPPPIMTDVDEHRWYVHPLAMEQVPLTFRSYVTYTRTNRKVERVDLVNASFSLPFCEPSSFSALWQWIVDRLLPGGRFAGQFFGVDDEWNVPADRQAALAMPPARIFHTRAEVERLLEPFKIEHLEEVSRMGKTSTGQAKHWHVFHVVGRKRP